MQVWDIADHSAPTKLGQPGESPIMSPLGRRAELCSICIS